MTLLRIARERFRLGLVGCCLVLAICAGCKTPASGEKSVKPGINNAYKNADVATWTKRFEVESREVFRDRREIARLVDVKAGSDVADIGAGTGLFTGMFAQATGPKGHVFAVDITPEFLAHIDRRAAEAGLANVTTVRCDEDSVTLAADSIDVAFVCDTYHHFEYPNGTMSSIHEALRPGGQLVVVDFERVPGVSRAWIVGHVRAGKEVVIREIESAGFRLVEDLTEKTSLEENYMLRFEKTQ